MATGPERKEPPGIACAWQPGYEEEPRNTQRSNTVKHGHCTGKKRERTPRKQTQAQLEALGAQIAQALAGKSPSELFAMINHPVK